MDPTRFIAQLEQNANIINTLLRNIAADQSRWKPATDRWSILEVVNHLYDEEREDFRLHLNIMLHTPAAPWPPIDPEGWITARQYNQREFIPSVQNFIAERQRSLAWLRSLPSPNWDNTVQAPWGIFHAGDMLASWVVHDQWHIQQLVQLIRDNTITAAAPYITTYAGSL
ncbi:MAG: DinB family protein [Anaerolineae bacterium]|nr:DinB family protein [Anaerolineae bacterium]